MSLQQAPMSPPYRPASPPGGILFSLVYRPSSPPGHRAWGSERFPDSFHLECPHPNCPGVLAPGHQVEETFAPIDPGVQPLATFHYEGCHAEGNPFNFISYPISCDLNDGCPPEVPYHQDASSVLEVQAQCQETRTLVIFFLIFSLWTLPLFYPSLHFSFTYCPIDSIPLSPLCSLWPVL